MEKKIVTQILIILPESLIQYITDFLDTYSALQWLLSNKYTNAHIKVKNLNHNPKCLTKEILEQKKYNKLEILNISGRNCKITNSDIMKFTKLKNLCADNNPNITNINHLINLEVLDASGMSGISDSSINELKKIKVLYVVSNHNITDINHLYNLRKLVAFGGNSGITDSSIKGLKRIKKLEVDNNPNITDINHLLNLETLLAFGNSGISDDGFAQLKKLKRIVSDNNEKITITIDSSPCMSLHKS